MQIFEEWLAEEPDDPIARHMLAACTGRDMPARASDGYVERTFDSFAASFESKLAKLVVSRAGAGRRRCWTTAGLDAGEGSSTCSTPAAAPGCAARSSRPYARRLTGVDLSAGMLAQAKEKQVYDELLKAELTGYLRDQPDAFDLIVSADTLVYFGALDEVVAAAAGALRPDGLLVFTLERGVGDAGAGLPPGDARPLHARAALRRAAAGRRRA